MGLLKQIMIFGKSGLQGRPTRVSGPLAAKGLLGSPYSQHGILWQARGEPQYLKTFRAGADPGSELSHLGLAPSRDCDLGRFGPGQTWILGPGLRVGGRMREELCTVRNSDL